jgi:hypothetical protein
VMGRAVNTGRFRSLPDMVVYGIERLRNLDVANPLATYVLAREFYEIMKLWPDSDLEGLLSEEYRRRNCRNSGEMYRVGGTWTPKPLSREELDELYRRYNEDPRAFLEENGLPVYPSILPDAGGAERAEGAGSGTEPRNANIDDFVNAFLGTPDYSREGTIDDSTRTGADDEAARRQIAREPEDEGRRAGRKKKEEGEKKYVYSINPRTKSRTRLSHVREFGIRKPNTAFLRKFRKWEHVADSIYRQLAFILPTVEEHHDLSATDGEVNMEMVIELLSDRGNIRELPEIFDIFRETRRSLEVVIGIDASGSTGASIVSGSSVPGEGEDSILDVEKAFAMIFGRALGFLTDRLRVLSFNSVTSTNVYRAESLDAVSAFVSDAGNRDGDFIRYVNDFLSRSDAEVKYFFLLSDGQPSADNYSGREALDDTLIAMRETVNTGVRLIYFNFDSERREYFDMFKNEATYARYFTGPGQILQAIPDLIATVSNSVR